MTPGRPVRVPAPPAGGSHVLLVGCGAIGSHLVPHLARLRGLSCVTLVDPQRYEASNLAGQAIDRRDVGRSKAEAQARRLRRLAPALTVRAIPSRVEDVPLGRLRADIALACLDSLRARQVINERARRLRMPWIDAGIDATGLLSRVSVYGPGPDAPCMECRWSAADYALVEQSHPCGEIEAAAPTMAPSGLSGLAAALMALECGRVLTGREDEAVAGREVLLDAAHLRCFVSRDARRDDCRFDHRCWQVERLKHGPHDLTFDDALALGGSAGCDEGRLRVAGSPVLMGLTCAKCGSRRPLFRLEASIRTRDRRCPRCGERTLATGLDTHWEIDRTTLRGTRLRRPLAWAGIRSGDVITIVGPEGESHHELA